LKSNSEIGPLFKFFIKSVHFYLKSDFTKNLKSGPISELDYKSGLVLQMPQKETQLQTRNVVVSSMELVLIFRLWLLKRNRETYFY
jgi:hypothetical protein